MAKFTHEYSNFPDELITVVNYKNVNDTIGDLINQINEYRLAGNYTAAQILISDYATQLKPYNLDMTIINTMVEEIRNTQIKSRVAGQFLSIDEDEPDGVWEGFVWLGGD
jgi:hypothetical protein